MLSSSLQALLPVTMIDQRLSRVPSQWHVPSRSALMGASHQGWWAVCAVCLSVPWPDPFPPSFFSPKLLGDWQSICLLVVSLVGFFVCVLVWLCFSLPHPCCFCNSDSFPYPAAGGRSSNWVGAHLPAESCWSLQESHSLLFRKKMSCLKGKNPLSFTFGKPWILKLFESK